VLKEQPVQVVLQDQLVLKVLKVQLVQAVHQVSQV
jgi:hypothetical protein